MLPPETAGKTAREKLRLIEAATAPTAAMQGDRHDKQGLGQVSYFEDTGGQQSASFAFLDANRTGTVVTAIQGRDYARIYVKELDRGRASVALSPEEAEAVERAMAR